ncbi:putative transposase for the insertion element IS2606 [Mycobacterium ulcerans str. Harvey]|uniref:Transposase for the insertion element IS2606 n=1 Tax=Mycobacterium ulcerans str. Harvey TaxID=1299332 RepID=A0ABN0QZ21_MYCUL|nr:putative transposase for the insertion element IS2606 [Mycobacterium ulcerans str. Harvey]
MTKTVIETALDEELSEHLGYDARSGWVWQCNSRTEPLENGAH